MKTTRHLLRQLIAWSTRRSIARSFDQSVRAIVRLRLVKRSITGRSILLSKVERDGRENELDDSIDDFDLSMSVYFFLLGRNEIRIKRFLSSFSWKLFRQLFSSLSQVSSKVNFPFTLRDYSVDGICVNFDQKRLNFHKQISC